METRANESINPLNSSESYGQVGLTKREYIATQIAIGLSVQAIAGRHNHLSEMEIMVPKSAVAIADSLIKELNKSVEGSSILEDNHHNKFAGPESGLSIGIKEALKGFSQESEEVLPYKEQVVWGSNNEGEKWCIGHFIKKEFNEYMISHSLDEEDAGKFSIITTKNPYEVEEDREPQIGDMCFFWDDRHIDKNAIVCGKLSKINTENNSFYAGSLTLSYKHCSLKNPLIK